ncbi:DUF4424 domain-containing protein [Bradyrhizobium sp. JYMT SZCCT0428]|uniref:DUF4424 domain-containing protein n=1 Tax=Bradyrhizobium sp. JYMT SZCCT0428 TaxID=2807673 RepID=UPI001BA91541|nr:DUF4424 domain-containing protein [Bradyrhizobium sp. JYMT SZCCT0428]MBR1155202.1 DUF4424 domain-containing protein [Bradyrhizobium sp. JYMT SZCCT0428]
MKRASRRYAVLFIVLSLIAGTRSALSNDTAAELSIGGLQFARSASVIMNSELLQISLTSVRVRYQFVNTGTAPVALSVAFPLPDIDLSEGENIAFPSSDPVNFVDFETKIDGKPTSFAIDQRAFVGKNDVTSVLKELKLPILPLGGQQLRSQDLSEATRSRLVERGLLTQMGSDERGRPLYQPTWLVKTAVVREQQFPGDRPVTVEHAYRPIVGGNSDTILRKALRQNKAMSQELEKYRKDYCITDAFLAQLDKIAGGGQANKAMIQERRVSYVLKTGANWAGPIKDFRLLVDKAGKELLVSFCTGSLKQSSEGALEFNATDFTPDRDIKLLFLGRF